ncbi:Hypothetical protein, putative [Bodo saltans]|uniref:EF-hand domain-containing protein n=1 Tax=Bodo saltans TaxID=75058 RepID=A0A0S4JJX2_BODSA|nr:Hypothetical protein, putative [Bodo saltans]|eukprot:CUG90465.1 Hypothetical protein, putative [Bodo saltans]
MYCSDSSDTDSESGDDGSLVFPFPTGSPVKAATLRFNEPPSSSSQQNTGDQPALPPLALKDMNEQLSTQPTSTTRKAAQGGGDSSPRQSPRQAPQQPTAELLSLNDTKRKLVLHNASVTPARCAEEDVVVQRFGEHMQRIPTPPVSKEAIHLTNSKEEKHLQNKLRLFGSVENMQKTYAGGVATMQKTSHKTVRCDVLPLTNSTVTPSEAVNIPSAPGTANGSSRAGTARSSTTHHQQSSTSGQRSSHVAGHSTASMVEANNLHHVFADVSFMERQQLLQYIQHPTNVAPPATPGGSPRDATPATPQVGGNRFLPSRGEGGGNNFFLVSRASHKERALLQSSMSARMGGSSGAGDKFPAIVSPRTPATAGRVSTSGGAMSRGGPPSQLSARGQPFVSPRLSSVGGGRMSPKSSQMAAAQLAEPDEFVLEDTSYVVQATKFFEKGALALAKRSWMENHSSASTADLSAARAENHTSDLLKMIFNARIALECEVALRLRQLAEESGVDKLITDAINTAQRLALRTANVSDFHLFLCNLLRDTDISFSETRVIFGAIDSNRSGSIDQSELSEGLRLLLLDESQLILTFAKKVFTEVGRHKDTKLSFLEVQAILFATLDFFETDFDAFEVIDAANLDPKSSHNNGDDGFELQSFPSVNAMQQAKLLSGKGGPKGGGPRMMKSNTLVHSPRRLSSDSTGGDPFGNTTSYSAGPALTRNDSMMFGGGSSAPTAPAPPPPPMEKPTLVSLKKKMVKECSTALREVWKYSQGGQIVVPLLRNLTTQIAPLLFLALTHVPVQHFHLKRSGFWKNTLAAEEIKYQQYVEQKSLEAEVQRAHFLAASIGMGQSVRSSTSTKKGRSNNNNHGTSEDFILGASTMVPPTPRTHQRGGRDSAFAPVVQPAHHARKSSTYSVKDDSVDNELIAQLIALEQQQQQASDGGALIPNIRKSSFASTAPAFGGGGGRRQSRAGGEAKSNISSLAGLEPISYEEYEEACGDTVNINALQAQLRDGSVRLSQAQRQMIAQQIEQGKEARVAAAAANARGDRKSISGFSGPPPVSIQRRGTVARGGAGKGKTQIVEAKESNDSSTTAEPRDDAFIQALQRKKSEGGNKSMRGGGGGAPDRIDLTEVVDPWHPRFQADHDKLSDQRRQLGAGEHNHNEYFSKQGSLFTKSPNGVIAPLAANEPTNSSSGRR